jgi:hypothetical protein
VRVAAVETDMEIGNLGDQHIANARIEGRRNSSPRGAQSMRPNNRSYTATSSNASLLAANFLCIIRVPS